MQHDNTVFEMCIIQVIHFLDMNSVRQKSQRDGGTVCLTCSRHVRKHNRQVKQLLTIVRWWLFFFFFFKGLVAIKCPSLSWSYFQWPLEGICFSQQWKLSKIEKDGSWSPSTKNLKTQIVLVPLNSKQSSSIWSYIWTVASTTGYNLTLSCWPCVHIHPRVSLPVIARQHSAVHSSETISWNHPHRFTTTRPSATYYVSTLGLRYG